MIKRMMIILAVVIGIAFLTTTFSIAQVDDQWKQVAQKFFEERMDKDGLVWNAWKLAVKNSFNLEMEQLLFSVEFGSQEDGDEDITIGIVLSITVLCFDEGGNKKNIMVTRVAYLIIDKNTKEVVITLLIRSTPPVIKDGWNSSEEI